MPKGDSASKPLVAELREKSNKKCILPACAADRRAGQLSATRPPHTAAMQAVLVSIGCCSMATTPSGPSKLWFPCNSGRMSRMPLPTIAAESVPPSAALLNTLLPWSDCRRFGQPLPEP